MFSSFDFGFLSLQISVERGQRYEDFYKLSDQVSFGWENCYSKMYMMWERALQLISQTHKSFQSVFLNLSLVPNQLTLRRNNFYHFGENTLHSSFFLNGCASLVRWHRCICVLLFGPILLYNRYVIWTLCRECFAVIKFH